MQACEYPELESHRQTHQMLIKQVKLNIKNFERGELTAQDLYSFLMDWLMYHIMHMDKDISHYAKGREKEVSMILKGTSSD